MPSVLCEELIGRSDALATGTGALDAARSRRGRVLFVTGEAGVGKSRLARELAERARDRGMAVLSGRAVAADVPVPFRPVAGALLAHVREDGLPEAPELTAFRPALGMLLPEWRVPGTAEPTVVLAEALVRVLRVVAGERGCLLVLEDLHWADPETLELLEYLADAIDVQPVVVLATVRSEEPSGARHLAQRLGASRSAAVLELGPLSGEHVAAMAAACLGQRLEGRALDLLRSWSDGLPFMVEELLAGALGAGALRCQDDLWVLDTWVAPQVPVTFADTVRGRLSRLGPEAREVMRYAAVLGRRFDWSLLPPATGLSTEAVVEGLKAGIAAQLLKAEPGSRFRFRHALTRDAVLGELLPLERADHAGRLLDAVLSAHEGLPGEWCEAAAALAEEAAREAEAAGLLVERARRALAAGALASAETILDRARLLTTQPGLHADIDEVGLAVLALAGKTGDAIAVGSRLADQLREIGTPSRRARAHLDVATAAVTACRWDVAEQHLEEARRRAAEAEDCQLGARIEATAAKATLGQADPTSARRQAEKALAGAERERLHEVACEALEVIGRCLRITDPAASEAAFTRALVIAQEHGLPLWQARAMSELGTIDQVLCADDRRLLEARELALSCGAWALVAHVDLSLGQLHLNHFDSREATAHLERAEDLARTLGLDLVRAVGAGCRALGHAQRADHEATERAFADTMAIADGDPVAVGIAWGARGLEALLREDRDGAKAHLARAAEVFSGLPTRPPVPTRAMHALLLVQDDPSGAATRETLSAMEEIRSVHMIVRGYLALADAVAHGRVGRYDEAQSAALVAEEALIRSDGFRHLAWRLVAPDAIADGWGEPVRWLREALAWFEDRSLNRPADATRNLLRGAGVPVPRRTKGAVALPEQLRAAGVTAREAEILALLAGGLANQAIADRMFLSARTVERHLANISAKVGTSSRSELVALAARTTP